MGQLNRAAKDWLATANPDGFSGDACHNGGCTRPVDRPSGPPPAHRAAGRRRAHLTATERATEPKLTASVSSAATINV